MSICAVVLAAGCGGEASVQRHDEREYRGAEIVEAAAAGNTERVLALLKSDHSQVHAVYSDSIPDTALHAASGSGRIDLIEILLQYGADVNVRGDLGRTPLHSAAHQGQVEAARLLLKRGADIEAKDELGMTPLLTAASGREPECLDLANLLLDQGAYLDLNSALRLGRSDDVRRILREEPNALDRTPWPKYVLHDAAFLTRILLDYRDASGWDADPAAVAEVISEGRDLIEMLVARQPPLDRRVHHSALTVAVQLPDPAIAEILLKYSSQPESHSTGPFAKLSFVAQCCSPRPGPMLKLLQRYGVD